MKTKEELKALKDEVETLNKKLAELTEEELSVVTGGVDFEFMTGPKVGKWYRSKETKAYEPSFPGVIRSYCLYCAEDMGGNQFRFEEYIWTQSGAESTVSYVKDSIMHGYDLEPTSAPFPLPEKFRGSQW